ncbi:MAG: K(+)/H(+) antiporter NhaP2 [Candidatus Omnitrophica bacterium]|nr:K(+)/H(+) antiporter NhaP2 [Candidatus Omnitrophota bacterium]
MHFNEALSTEYLILGAAFLLIQSIIASKISSRFGIPALLLFMGVGMLAGSDGPGGIVFDNAWVAKSLGVIALSYILFSGGLDTDAASVRHIVRRGVSLATLGVVLTAGLVGAFAHLVLGFPLLEGLLLGAVVSSTDAAAVFSILRSHNVSLKRKLKPLLELESGSNDPMAVFLTLGILQLIASPGTSPVNLVLWFVQQMVLGAILGWVFARVTIFTINKIKLEYDGLYPVVTLAFVMFIYSFTSVVGGNGFLAVYIAGIVMSRKDFLYKRTLTRFHDGIAWLMQIVMFLALGLLVYPSRLLPVAGAGFVTALFLMLVARPVSVFISLAFARMSLNERVMISWVGLRGAAPVILSTFVLLAAPPGADLIFNIVFFVVLLSVLLQGTTIPLVAKWLKVDAPLEHKRRYPIEFEPTEGVNTDLVEYMIPFNAAVAGKAIYELGLPADCLVTMICRNDQFIVAGGKTVLEEGDIVLALVNPETQKTLLSIFSKLKA